MNDKLNIAKNKLHSVTHSLWFASVSAVIAFAIMAPIVSIAQQAPNGLPTNPGLSSVQQQQEIAAANAVRAALQSNTANGTTNVSIPQAPVVTPNMANAQSAQATTSPIAPPTQITNVPPPIPALENRAAGGELPPPQANDAVPNSADIDAAREQAFSKLTLNALPMTPQQIQKLRDLFATSQRAAASYPGGSPPKPVASTQIVTLQPGATPPIIRLAQGYVTSVVFLDSTGAPWPIQGYDVGNPGAFNIQWDHTSNNLFIQSSAMYTIGNLAVQLKGLNTPVMITLIPGQPIVDYRIDMRVQGLGPNAQPGHYGVQLPQAASNKLIGVLDGVAPDKSKPLTIPGSNSQAWLVGDTIYLRTQLTLLSPAWTASMSSADGTNVYQIPKTPSILVGNSDGKIFNLRIEGY